MSSANINIPARVAIAIDLINKTIPLEDDPSKHILELEEHEALNSIS